MQTLFQPVELQTDSKRLSVRKPPSPLRSLLASWKLYLALLPTFIVLGVLSYYPAISGLYHSLYDWRPGFDSPFVGFTNFTELFHNSVFLRSFVNIILFFIFGITLAWIVPFLAARMVLTLSNSRARFIFRTLLLIPMAFPMIVNFYLWGFLYEPNVGLINTFLRAIGLAGWTHNWLGDPNIALYSLMFLNAPWIASVPFLLFMSGLQAIPGELFDAAAIDGAGWWRCITKIDLPMLVGQFRLLFVLAIISFIQLAVPMATLTNGGPAFATMTPTLYMINTAFVNGDWGMAAAISALIFALTLIFSIIALRVQQRRPEA